MRVVHATSAHRLTDARIFQKECRSLASHYAVTLIGPGHVVPTDDGVSFDSIEPTSGRWARFTVNVLRVAARLIRTRAAVYHLHDPELIPIGLIMRLMGRRVIYDAHENLPAQLAGRDWIPRVVRPLVVLAARCLELAAGRSLSAVVAATPSIAAAYGHRAVVVQNFPTASEFGSDAIEYQSRTNAVAYIGGISALRGAKPMVQAISLVDSTLEPQLELAGSFQPPALRDECEREAGWQRTRFHEWIGRKEVAEVLRRARVGLVVFQPAPNHLESYPTKLFEYLSAGIPVVASDFPLWRRLIVDGGYGLVVDPQSPRAIAEAISHLLAHPDEAERMGARGRKAVMTQFNWAVEEQKLLKLYREVLR